ncbi:MAG: SDR family NAD(P)-dependent oxidoreductase [Acidimicrobiales bacterium]
MTSSLRWPSLADAALEATIVGSFTKVGIRARNQLFDWDDDLPSMAGQEVVITGATSGIGRATAQAILDLGANVHLTSRSDDRAQQAAEELNRASDGGRATGYGLDTSDLESIAAFAAELDAVDRGLDVLIHNAGALTSKYLTDARGNELTLSSHLIGPYELTKRLRPALNVGARVLFMSSGGMYTQKLDVDSIEMTEENYRGAVAYARAKRGQVELVTHLGPLWAPEVRLHAMHPGWVDTPGVDAALPGFGRVMGPLLRNAEQGADTMVWLAATGGDDAPAGSFWLDRRVRRTHYLPGTGASAAERVRLIEWLDAR